MGKLSNYDSWKCNNDGESELAEYIDYMFNNLNEEELELLNDDDKYKKWVDQIISGLGQENLII